MLFKISKLNINKIEFFFIKLQIINEIQLELLEDINNICNYKNKLIINDIIILYFESNLNKNELNNMINLLLNNEVFKFDIYLLNFNNNINYLNIKVTKIYFQDKNLNIDLEFFPTLIKFLEKYVDLKKFNNNYKLLNIKEVKSKDNKNLLLVKNFSKLNIDFVKLLNFFYIFGNINEIYYNFYASTIYINYESLIALNRILLNKDSLIINNVLLDISISNYSFRNNNYFIRPIVFKKNLNLYKNKYYKIKFNRPSKVIMICNIAIDFKLFDFYKIILKYSNPLYMKLNQNKSKKSYIWLIKFNNTQESINLLIHISNSKQISNQLRINFSSNNICF